MPGMKEHHLHCVSVRDMPAGCMCAQSHWLPGHAEQILCLTCGLWLEERILEPHWQWKTE